MRVEAEAEVGADLARVWAWWTDFGREGDEMRVTHGLGSSKRRILRVAPGEVVFEDRSLLGSVRRTVRLDAEGHAFTETGDGDQRYEARWTFEPAGEGRTRVRRAMRVRAHAAFGPFTRALVRVDLRHHARQAERELGR